MVNNINEFKSSINAKGVQRSNKFSALIAPPVSLRNNSLLNDLIYRINSINWPGVTFSLDEFKPMGYGLTESRPIARTTDEISLTIIGDNAGNIYKLFNQWLELIFPTNNDKNSSELELYEYPVNYYGVLELYILDETGKTHTSITFEKPFLTAVGSVTMGWDNLDSIVYIPIQIKYKSYKINSTYSGSQH